MQYREVFQTDEQTEQCRKKLGKNRSPGSTGNTHMEWYNKQDVQKNVQDRGKHQKIKRCFTVAQRTKHIGDHIIKNSCARSEKNDKHVIVSFAGNILRNLHPAENLVSQQAADQSQDNGKNNTEQCRYSNTFAHTFFVLCTTPLAKADTESTGKAIDKAKDKIDNDTGGTNCCKGISTKRFADDHRVSKCIKKLKKISENNRNCKF